MIVLDASVVIDLLLRTHAAIAVEKLIFAPGESLHVPELIDIEVAQVLRRYAAKGILSPAQGNSALRVLGEIPMERHSHQPLLGRIWQLRGNLTAYDAAYVALAEGLDAPLVTRDTRITSAPGHRARTVLVCPALS